MTSTMERGFVVKNGVASFPMKEYPDWYGIPNIGFIWHGNWSDPEIEYKGKRIDSYIVEDTMWERWIHDDNDNLIPEREGDDDGFAKYMRDNADEVCYLIDLAMGNIDV